MSSPSPEDAARILADLEQTLDPADPTARGGLQVLSYGEVSVALRVTGLPGLVCKRMSGFRDAGAVAAYERLVADYLARLRAAGVRAVPTAVVAVPRAERPPVVYLLQPELAADSLGHRRLAAVDDATLGCDVDRVLAAELRVHRASAAGDVELAVDGQLSNWSFPPAGTDGDPVLVDVGTPFMRRDGRHLLDTELFLSAVPPVLRAFYRRRRMVEAYLDDYFVPRLVAVDLLGNLHKEGTAERIPLVLERVNAWLRENSAVLGDPEPVTREEVDRYYRTDAKLLALFLRLRRLDRFLRTRVLRQGYDFVLPGPVRR